MVELTPNNVRKLIKALNSLGYRSRLPVNPELIADPIIRRKWITEKNMKVFSFYHRRIPVQEVDILVTAPLKVEQALKKGIIKQAGNLRIPVVTISDLIKMKKRWDVQLTYPI